MNAADITQAVRPIVEELGVQIDVLDREGRQYAERLLHHHLHNNRGAGAPHRPAGMHHDIAKAIRDLVLDEVMSITIQGPRRIIGGSRT